MIDSYEVGPVTDPAFRTELVNHTVEIRTEQGRVIWSAEAGLQERTQVIRQAGHGWHSDGTQARYDPLSGWTVSAAGEQADVVLALLRKYSW